MHYFRNESLHKILAIVLRNKIRELAKVFQSFRLLKVSLSQPRHSIHAEQRRSLSSLVVANKRQYFCFFPYEYMRARHEHYLVNFLLQIPVFILHVLCIMHKTQ